VVIYSVVDQDSFNYAEDIVSYLNRFGFTSNNSVIVVANKVDLERSRAISTEGKISNLYITLNILVCDSIFQMDEGWLQITK